MAHCNVNPCPCVLFVPNALNPAMCNTCPHSRENHQPVRQSPTDILHQLRSDYCTDFQNIFHVTGNATLRCRNQDLDDFNSFFHRWVGYFEEENMRIAQINLERARFGDIGTVNENKQIIIRLYGVAFNIYIKSCQILRRQPNDQYASLVYIDYQQTPTTGDTPSSQ